MGADEFPYPTYLDWWRAHENMPPTLVLICDIDGCHDRVGEVKSEGETAIALIYSKFGDRTVPYTPRATEESLGFPSGEVLRDAKTGETLAERERRRFDELDAETLRYLDDATRVAKRYSAQPTAMTVDLIGHIVCPRHGVVGLPDPDATVARLRAFLDDTEPGTRRRFLMFRGTSLD